MSLFVFVSHGFTILVSPALGGIHVCSCKLL